MRTISASAVILLVSVMPAAAQAPKYLFTPIAVDDGTLWGGVTCVALNDAGTVVVHRTASQRLWSGNGGPLTLVEANTSTMVCPSINGAGEIAYTIVDSGSGATKLVRNANGVVTTLAATNVAPALGSTLFPLSDTGNAAYGSTGGAAGIGPGIYIGPSGVPVYNSYSGPALSWVSPASMNNADVVVFRAQTNSGVAGIYRGSSAPLIQSGDAVSGGVINIGEARPVINNSGRVAFTGRLDIGGVTGTFGVFTTDDGTSVTRVGTQPIDRISINDAGSVAYRKSGSGGSGIYIGRAGSIDRTVIAPGGLIDGSTLLSGLLWEEALNNKGQVAFFAQLADGRTGVYRADPLWMKALSFTAKIPGCGPITGKVVLLGPAPPGGLTISLTSTNPAASVPATVVVPAGKSSVTFAITPTAVLSNAIGSVTAVVGTQSVSRALTVRPIAVKSLTLSPNPVVGTNPVTGTVTLDCAAAPADITVKLSTSNAALAHPAVTSLLFSAGTASRTFSITTASVTSTTAVTLRASANGITKGSKLTITP